MCEAQHVATRHNMSKLKKAKEVNAKQKLFEDQLHHCWRCTWLQLWELLATRCPIVLTRTMARSSNLLVLAVVACATYMLLPSESFTAPQVLRGSTQHEAGALAQAPTFQAEGRAVQVSMAATGGEPQRLPLVLIGLLAGTAAVGILALFFYGSYSGAGSGLWRTQRLVKWLADFFESRAQISAGRNSHSKKSRPMTLWFQVSSKLRTHSSLVLGRIWVIYTWVVVGYLWLHPSYHKHQIVIWIIITSKPIAVPRLSWQFFGRSPFHWTFPVSLLYQVLLHPMFCAEPASWTLVVVNFEFHVVPLFLWETVRFAALCSALISLVKKPAPKSDQWRAAPTCWCWLWWHAPLTCCCPVRASPLLRCCVAVRSTRLEPWHRPPLSRLRAVPCRWAWPQQVANLRGFLWSSLASWRAPRLLASWLSSSTAPTPVPAAVSESLVFFVLCWRATLDSRSTQTQPQAEKMSEKSCAQMSWFLSCQGWSGHQHKSVGFDSFFLTPKLGETNFLGARDAHGQSELSGGFNASTCWKRPRRIHVRGLLFHVA